MRTEGGERRGDEEDTLGSASLYTYSDQVLVFFSGIVFVGAGFDESPYNEPATLWYPLAARTALFLPDGHGLLFFSAFRPVFMNKCASVGTPGPVESRMRKEGQAGWPGTTGGVSGHGKSCRMQMRISLRTVCVFYLFFPLFFCSVRVKVPSLVLYLSA